MNEGNRHPEDPSNSLMQKLDEYQDTFDSLCTRGSYQQENYRELFECIRTSISSYIHILKQKRGTIDPESLHSCQQSILKTIPEFFPDGVKCLEGTTRVFFREIQDVFDVLKRFFGEFGQKDFSIDSHLLVHPGILQIQKYVGNRVGVTTRTMINASKRIENDTFAQQDMMMMCHYAHTIFVFSYVWKGALGDFWEKIKKNRTGLDIEVETLYPDLWENQYKHLQVYREDFGSLVESIGSGSCIDDCIYQVYESGKRIDSFFDKMSSIKCSSAGHADFWKLRKKMQKAHHAIQNDLQEMFTEEKCKQERGLLGIEMK